MTLPYWLAIALAVFALGTLVEDRIAWAFDSTVALLIALPILVVLWIWDALVDPIARRTMSNLEIQDFRRADAALGPTRRDA